MTFAFRNAWLHPKTTIMGIGTVIVGAYVLIQSDPQYADLKVWLSSHGYWGAKLVTFVLVVKLVLALGSEDRGRQEVQTPSGSAVVDSKELPNSGAPVAPKEAGQ